MRALRFAGAAAALALSLALGTPEASLAQVRQAQWAKSPSVQRGVVIARTYCARCHSIDKVSRSPLAIAPPFRDLHKSYPVERLEEPLAEGLVTGHPSMPEFRFDPDQIGDFIAFLKSLE
ncbi:MAG: cytochrome c [Pseudorhodoplanes sp.]|jgi:mono/diheme cytochrome c family protein|nr:cytochrome c [Pseudorhodoplanes sp.]